MASNRCLTRDVDDSITLRGDDEGGGGGKGGGGVGGSGRSSSGEGVGGSGGADTFVNPPLTMTEYACPKRCRLYVST